MAWLTWLQWRSLFPKGVGLPDDVWHRRHRLLNWILLAHVPLLSIFGLIMCFEPLHLAWEVGILVVLWAAGRTLRLRQRFRELATSLGLISASALTVHFSGGFIEAHFHFFVMLPLIALYQRWLPFVASVLFIALHHGITGALSPTSVYNHPAAIIYPWRWAAIHASFILLESLALFRLWREVEEGQEAAAVEKAKAEQLMEVQLLKDRLLRTVSHELNTPLTPIKLQLELMSSNRTRDSPDTFDKSMSMLDRNFTRLERIVKSVLDVVRIDGDYVHLHPQEHDVSELSTAAITAYKEIARRQDVTLVSDLVPTLATVDGERISQVIDNFLSNAIKYSPAGGKVTVQVRPEADTVRIAVTDEGRGLTAEEKTGLFEAFGMVHGEDDAVATTGLGLYICKGIIETHGGTIGADSAGSGQGATFWATFPKENRKTGSHSSGF